MFLDGGISSEEDILCDGDISLEYVPFLEKDTFWKRKNLRTGDVRRVGHMTGIGHNSYKGTNPSTGRDSLLTKDRQSPPFATAQVLIHFLSAFCC